MKAVFVELPVFAKFRAQYLDDEAYRELQMEILKNPECGDLIPGTGGLRKLRFQSYAKQKGKRGGLRVIYYWCKDGSECWLFTLYAKNELQELTPMQKKILKKLLADELVERK